MCHDASTRLCMRETGTAEHSVKGPSMFRKNPIASFFLDHSNCHLQEIIDCTKCPSENRPRLF